MKTYEASKMNPKPTKRTSLRRVGYRVIVQFLSAAVATFIFIKKHSRSTIQNNNYSYGPNHNFHDDEYLNWLDNERMRKIPLPITIYYRCQSGLGHQLTRLAAAYHLALLYKIPRIFPTSNPMCGDNIFTIHNYLLGPYNTSREIVAPLLVDVPYSDNNIFLKNSTLFRLPAKFPNLTITVPTVESQALRSGVNLNNEVEGYQHFFYRAQYDRIIQNEFWGKDKSDYQLYSQFMGIFSRQHSDRVKMIMEETQFQQHTVFGLHIRAGNGETGGFVSQRRTIKDLDNWMIKIIDVLCAYRQLNSHYFNKYPLMLYLATDTASVVPKIQSISNEKCSIPIVSADQAYPEEGAGVSFLAYAGQRVNQTRCLNGWRDMVLDMFMMTQCNTVIAGTYSSFTQTAPLSYVFHKAKIYNNQITNSSTIHPHYFCEMGISGDRMDCFDNLSSWIKNDPAVVSGNLNAEQQFRRIEIKFPSDDKTSTASITKLFENTLLNPPTETPKD